MGCNCKNSVQAKEINENRTTGNKITHYFLKTLMFLFIISLLPIINIYLVYIIFKMIVLNKEIDIKPLLLAIGEKFKEKIEEDEDEEDDVDFDSLTPDDVVMLDAEDITEKSFK